VPHSPSFWPVSGSNVPHPPSFRPVSGSNVPHPPPLWPVSGLNVLHFSSFQACFWLKCATFLLLLLGSEELFVPHSSSLL